MELEKLRQLDFRQTDPRAQDKYQKNYEQSKGRGGTGLLDTWGATEGLFGFGGKGKDLQEVLDDPTTKYTPGQGYKLNWWQKNISRITDQDVYNALRSKEVDDLINSPLGRAAKNKYNLDVDGSTNIIKLGDEIEKKVDSEEALKELEKTGGYEGSISALKGRPASEIRALIPDAQRRKISLDDAANPATIRAEARKVIEDNRYHAGLERESNRLKETDKRYWADKKESDRRYALQQERLWQQDRDNRAERALTREQNAENNRMQMQLEYSRLERQDRRDAKSDRDKAIMLILQGFDTVVQGLTI